MSTGLEKCIQWLTAIGILMFIGVNMWDCIPSGVRYDSADVIVYDTQGSIIGQYNDAKVEGNKHEINVTNNESGSSIDIKFARYNKGIYIVKDECNTGDYTNYTDGNIVVVCDGNRIVEYKGKYKRLDEGVYSVVDNFGNQIWLRCIDDKYISIT